MMSKESDFYRTQCRCFTCPEAVTFSCTGVSIGQLHWLDSKCLTLDHATAGHAVSCNVQYSPWKTKSKVQYSLLTRETRGQKRFFLILEVAAELMTPQHTMQYAAIHCPHQQTTGHAEHPADIPPPQSVTVGLIP